MTLFPEGERPSSPSNIVDVHGQPKGGLNTIKNFIREKVSPDTLPTEEDLGYKSESAFYGTRLRTDAHGQMYFDYRNILTKIDRIGDLVLRITDDNVMKKPGALIIRHPTAFFEQLARGPKRYRGNITEILANIERLGLTDRYEAYCNEKGETVGIAIKDNFMRKGRTLRNLWRAQRSPDDPTYLQGAHELRGIDRFQALADATRFIRERHDRYGAFAEVNADDIIFTKLEDNQLREPTFSVPDIVYNENVTMTEREKRAIDLLDFMMDIAEEERVDRRLVIQTVIENYADPAVIRTIKSFIKRGRLTLAGDKAVLDQPTEIDRIPNLPDTVTTRQRSVLAIHNQTRFRVQEPYAVAFKRMIVEACDKFQSRDGQPQADTTPTLQP